MGVFDFWKDRKGEQVEGDEGVQVYHNRSDSEGSSSIQKKDTIKSYTTSVSDNESNIIVDPEESSGSKGYNHVFKNPEVAKYWMDLYDETKYESRHLIDPQLTWSPEEERKVVFKADLHACLWAFIMFLALDIDRYNLANAVSDNLLEDLKLSKSDYNLGNTLNLVCFLAAELPSQLVSKAVGADRFLPTQVTLWSIVAVCQCKMKSRAGFLATRCLVGFLEGGFLPEQITWLSYFYTHDEFIKRSAWFYIANPLTQMFSGLLAAAIQKLEGHGGWAGWQYVFLIEGLITLVIGLISFKMPAGPANTRTWFRKKGWFTDREEKIMANRIVRDDPSKGTMNNRTGLSATMFWRAITDYDMWPMYLTRLTIDIIDTPLGQYIPILLRGMGFSSIKTNLLMVPYCFVQIITMVLQSHFAAKFKQNGFALFVSPLWLLVPLICMRSWPNFLNDHWGSYALLFVTLSYPPIWPITISWSSANSFSVSRRTVSSALMNMFSQAGGIIGSNVFQESDAPRYDRGLEALIGIASAGCILVLFTRYYYYLRNKFRERKWRSMSPSDQIEYINNTSDEGNKRLDNRFFL